MSAVWEVVKPPFGDVKLKWAEKLTDPHLVLHCIESHLQEWKDSDVPSIWIKLQGTDLNHINLFLSNGFALHRIKNDTILVLNRWIRSGRRRLPPGPFAYIACGVICTNEQGLVLGVRENYIAGPGTWQTPGGLFDPTKDQKLSDCAVRECFEETGVRTRFEFIACTRFHPNSGLWHREMIYCICRATPLTTEIHFDPEEIADCQWLKPDDFLDGADPTVRRFLEISLSAKRGKIERSEMADILYYTKL
jgi:8-oxo-dGTP pyrophosphatase MutT (NUDIX family)